MCLRFIFAAFEFLPVEDHVITPRVRGVEEASFLVDPRASVSNPRHADECASRSEIFVCVRVDAVPFSFVSFGLAGSDLVPEPTELTRVSEGVSIACPCALEDFREEAEVVDVGDEYSEDYDDHEGSDALESMFVPWVNHR